MPDRAIKAIIVEDEPKGRSNLKSLLAEYCGEVSVIGEAESIGDAQVLLARKDIKPDLAFLDVQLPDGLVFQLLNQLKQINFDVIFVTAFHEFAVTAFDYSSVGYIVKPIDPDKLREAVSRAQPIEPEVMGERIKLLTSQYNNPNAFEKMSISALDGIYFINIRNIIRCEADDNYTHIYVLDRDKDLGPDQHKVKKITVSKTIKTYEEMLKSLNFYRVHKSHLINLNYMHKFVKGDGGYLVMDDGKRIEVSRRRRAAFMEQMRRLH